MSKPEVLMEGVVFGESPRWHDGRIWFSDWGAHQVIALDTEGSHEVVATDVGNQHCVRVREGGEVLATADLDRGAFACALSRGDNPRLFVVAQT